MESVPCITRGFVTCSDLPDVAIGLNDMEEEGPFVWMDGSPSGYQDWGPGNPDGSPGNGDMVRITKQDGVRTWMDAGTKMEYPFICSSNTCPPGILIFLLP